MTPEIKVIQQLSINGIFEVTSSTEGDLKAWIANGNYRVVQPLAPSSKNRATKFEVSVQQVDIFHAAMANDCNRFALAAIESMLSIGRINRLPKSTGWATVQMYYSAFFAAHALLRSFGRACSQLDSDHVDKVFQIANLMQLDSGVSDIENGFYLSITTGNNLSFSKLKDSHADTWSSFSSLLTWLIDNIPKTTGLGKHKSDAITLLSNIKAAIHKSESAKGNWLSQIRNKVNYQHTHGVWYPYRGALHDADTILKDTEWLKSPNYLNLSLNQGDIYGVYNTSNAILSLMYHLIKYGYERSGKVSFPLKNGLFRLINQIQVA